jgi:perosamine synthetase
MGLAALNIGPGDEVILPDTSWIASAAPVTYLGATPVFVDVRSDSWCLDPAMVEAAISPKTRAIMAVHLYGNVCDMDALLAIGERHGLPVIEDAAEAIGSEWAGRKAGSIGKFGTFSFHGTKTLTTGEGGMFVTDDHALYDRALMLSNHGRAPGQKRQFWPDAIGYKYKMSNLQAAVGCAQIERIDELIARKRQIFQAYADALLDIPGIRLNPEPAGTRNGYWMPTALFSAESGISREALLAEFHADNIDGRVFFWPLSGLPMFEPRPDNRVAQALPDRAINLPSYHEMTDVEQCRVIDAVLRVCRRSAMASTGALP